MECIFNEIEAAHTSSLSARSARLAAVQRKGRQRRREAANRKKNDNGSDEKSSTSIALSARSFRQKARNAPVPIQIAVDESVSPLSPSPSRLGSAAESSSSPFFQLHFLRHLRCSSLLLLFWDRVAEAQSIRGDRRSYSFSCAHTHTTGTPFSDLVCM